MDVEIIASQVSDNFFYAVHDAGEAALIDPIDGASAVDWVRENGLELRYLVNTHFHHDHVGGNPTVLDAFPEVEWIVGETDAARVEDQVDGRSIDQRVAGGDAIEVGNAQLDVLDTPGHTPGHISLRHGDHLFSGDTIFVGGAGNCSFGGDPGVLFRTFRDVLSTIDDSVTFYPGHDYSVRDIEFILSIEPDNARAEKMLGRARATDEDEVFLTTLGEERSYSPFFRFGEPGLQGYLAEQEQEVWKACESQSDSDDETAFRCIRELRNRW